MLRNLKDIEGFAIKATDGILGHVRDFYFDDEAWVLRYFVVETGMGRANSFTLISPMAMGVPDWSEKLIPAALTQEQVKRGPDMDTDKPRWLPGGSTSKASKTRRQNELHLRSINSVVRYHVHATDGDIGHIQGILVEEKIWAIRYIIVNTGNWWLGHEVLIAPEWIDDVYWAESKLMVDLRRDSLRSAPAYASNVPITQEQEKIVHAFFGHAVYAPTETERDGSNAFAALAAEAPAHDVPLE